MALSIIPRLNYHYAFKDLIISLSGLFKKHFNYDELKFMYNVDEVLFFNHARTAMRIALNSLGLKKGATVGLMGFNCLTVMNSIKLAGFNLLYIDVTDDFQIDMSDFNSKAGKMDALIINHMFGIPNRTILEIRKDFPTLPVIEDCAHSFMTTLNGKLTGTFGDMAVFSYGKGKFPSVGDGGFLVINNKAFMNTLITQYKELEPITFISEIKNITTSVLLGILHMPFIYKNITLKLFKGIDNKKDIVGKYSTKEQSFYKSNLNLFLSKIKAKDQLLNKQKTNGKAIQKEINAKFVAFKGDYNYFMLPIFLEKRDEFIEYCAENGVEVGKHFSKSIQWAKEFGYVDGSCPNAEKIAEKIVTIPCHYNFFKNKIQLICELIKNYNNE